MSVDETRPDDVYVYVVYTKRGPKVVTREEWEKDWLDWYHRTNQRN